MEKRERLFAKINPVLYAIYAGFGLVQGIYNVIYGTPYFYLLAFSTALFLAVPWVLEKAFHLRLGHQFTCFYLIFCFLLHMVGLVMRGYYVIPYFDKFAHTLSGPFCTLAGLALFYILKPVKKIEKSDFGLASVFSLAVSVAIAGLWEISEYAISLLFGTDPQNVLGTGVGDTMTDMIVCTAGSLLLFISIYFYYRKGKKSFLMGAFEQFFHLNYEK